MDGKLINKTVVCCFCGDSVPIKEALVINLQASIMCEEIQTLFAHKQHFVEKVYKSIPLNLDFFED